MTFTPWTSLKRLELTFDPTKSISYLTLIYIYQERYGSRTRILPGSVRPILVEFGYDAHATFGASGPWSTDRR